MAPHLFLTPEVLSARRYAAGVRILVALAAGLLLVVEPPLARDPLVAAAGFAVIAVTGVIELVVPDQRRQGFEEALSCVAVVCIVGFSGGRVDVLSVLWLVAAASGVLARGGRAGRVAPVLVMAALFSPLVTEGGMSASALGFAYGSIALLLVTGRICRETAGLLHAARHDAAHDSLTGLLSRSAFRDQVDALASVATAERPATLIAVDLDDFGTVNKRLGHAAGDRLLVEVSDAMRSTLRAGELLGRIGGDEFAALVFTDDPKAVAGRLVEAAGEGDGAGRSACAGIASCPDDGTSAEALLAAADVALRLAKRAGRTSVNRYDGAPISSDRVHGARAALERLCRGDGLEMATQPIVDLETGRAHAYEALARFSTRGGQGPLHWFALADALGMRAELELACLEASLRLLPDRPPNTRLSVNLSAPMILDERTAGVLGSRSSLTGLILEITEEALVRYSGETEQVIAGLRERGVRMAVDDVGAGYSGLGQLAALRPTYVKLDRGLVRGLDRDPGRVALVKALTEYARGTGGLLVAEGVETAEELAHVRAAGAPLGQGFLLGRPAPSWPVVDPPVLRPPPVAVAR